MFTKVFNNIRKYKNGFIISFTILISIFIFASCDVISKPPAELIKRPKLSVNNKIAKELIDSELHKGYEFVRPLKPGTLTSVDYFDWDLEDGKECYAFYKCKQEKKIGVMVLKKQGETWTVISHIKIAGEDIAYADFVDLNSDGVKDLLFGSEKREGVYGVANAYLWQDSQYEKVWSDVFTELIIDDMDGDENKEIICLKHDRNNSSSVVAYKYEDNYFKVLDEIDLDIYISGYYNVFSDYYNKEQKGLFLDFNLGSKSATNIMRINDGKILCLFEPLKTEQDYKISEKSNDIKSKDINEDGIVEFASNYKLNFNNKEFKNRGIYAWKQYEKNESIDYCRVVSLSYIDKNDYYEFIFPEKWTEIAKKGEISAIISGDKDKRKFVSFFYIGSDLNTYELLTIENFDKTAYAEWKNSEISDYYEVQKLYSGRAYNIVAYYNKDLIPYNEEDKEIFDGLMLTESEIKKNFKFIK